ncbi:unnamed protein product [Phytomonas sp. Hart1]|nr:unnamed protein product [Phytomonas sp. Hart1]|eukprot:CCW68474.1 unnamed protein product [Phytomonas sp. isolate Hart1]
MKLSSPRYQGVDDIPEDALFNRIRKKHVPFRIFRRAITMSRLQSWTLMVGVLGGAAFFIGPWLWDEIQEATHKKFIPLPPSSMPRTSPTWWENEWQKGNPLWRHGEDASDFYKAVYNFIWSQTGRDLSTAERFIASNPDPKVAQGAKCKTKDGELKALPEVLVPLCGDSLIIRTMGIQGYDVHGIEVSETAVRSLVQRTELLLPIQSYKNIHIHWDDFFSTSLWEGPLKGKKFDIIYERQGITSLNRDQRPNYVYLLKQALKDDGLIYVEGIFRTGRVKGNKVRGPPYSLSHKEIEYLFPTSEGYFVRCEEKVSAMSRLSLEDRVLRRVPQELYVTPFKCVVFRAAGVNLKERDAFVSAEAEKCRK